MEIEKMQICSIQKWMQTHFASQGLVISTSAPLFEQLDSLQVVSFILACNEEFQCFSDFTTIDLSEKTFPQIAEVIIRLSKQD